MTKTNFTHHLGRLLFLRGWVGQLGPDVQIIVRPKTLASDDVRGELFNAHALFWRDSAQFPIADCSGRHLQAFSQHITPAGQSRGDIHRVANAAKGLIFNVHAPL